MVVGQTAGNASNGIPSTNPPLPEVNAVPTLSYKFQREGEREREIGGGACLLVWSASFHPFSGENRALERQIFRELGFSRSLEIVEAANPCGLSISGRDGFEGQLGDRLLSDPFRAPKLPFSSGFSSAAELASARRVVGSRSEQLLIVGVKLW